MPIYEYRCKKCGKRFEQAMSLSRHEKRAAPACPKCKGKGVQQLVSGFQAVTSKKS